jgi:DNA-binding transcriptional LysR family regulator
LHPEEIVMELNQLKLFCAVVEKKSFSRASEAVFLSQPTVSLQISSLEKELDTRLLDRQGREVTTTRTGETLYHYARRILRLVDEAEQAIEQLKGLVKGELTLGASTIPGEYILPSLLAEFKQKYPAIDINLVIDDTKGIVEKVARNEVELGVVGTREKSDKLVFDSFTSERLVLISPTTRRWFKHELVTIEELREVPFILRESGSGTRATVKQRLQQAGIKEEDLTIVMRLGSTAAVKRAVESGAGVSFISEKAIENEIKLGTIKTIPLKDLELDRKFFIVYRRQKSRSPATQALLQFLKEKKEQA